MAYFKKILGYEHVLVRSGSDHVHCPFDLVEDPEDGTLYWNIKEDPHYTATGKKLDEFEPLDVDEILSRIVSFKLKRRITPQKAHNDNKELAERVSREIEIIKKNTPQK